MQSMIKRKVDISFTAHVEMLLQLVMDAYTINTERYVNKGRGHIVTQPGNFLYYRMTRQTGHTAALKSLLSENFRTKNDVYVFGLFHSDIERQAVFDATRNMNSGEAYEGLEHTKKNDTSTLKNFLGTNICNANIIVVSDTLHDPKRLHEANTFFRENAGIFTNLGLVVYLG